MNKSITFALIIITIAVGMIVSVITTANVMAHSDKGRWNHSNHNAYHFRHHYFHHKHHFYHFHHFRHHEGHEHNADGVSSTYPCIDCVTG